MIELLPVRPGDLAIELLAVEDDHWLTLDTPEGLAKVRYGVVKAALGQASAENEKLIGQIPAVQFTAVTRDAAGFVTAAAAVWPDGTAGTYAAVINAAFGVVESWTLTKGAKTFSQAAPTRDAEGQVVTAPAVAVSG